MGVDDNNKSELLMQTLEELLLINEPIPIRIKNNQSSDESHGAKLFPYQFVKEELEKFVEEYGHQNCSGKKVNQMELLEFNSPLFNKLVNWSYVIDGTHSPRTAIKQMGHDTVNVRSNLDQYIQSILELFPKEYILDCFEKGKTKAEISARIQSSEKNLKSAYAARKYRTKVDNQSIPTILNSTYPEIEEKTGLLPSEILWLTPFSNKRITKLINELYYGEEDIRSEALQQYPLGKKLVFHIRHPDNRPDTKNKNSRTALKKGHSEEILKYLTYEKASIKNALNDVGSRADIARLMELEFSFCLSVIAKYDPHMLNFPELRKIINSPLEQVLDPTRYENTQLLHEKTRIADGRFIAGGKSYLIEIKKGIYTHKSDFFKSLNKYNSSSKWSDGNNIDERLLFVDKVENGDFSLEKIKDWNILRGSEYKSIFNNTLELLNEYEPEFFSTSPLNSKESLNETHALIHDKSFILARRGNRMLRGTLKELYHKNFAHITTSNGVFSSYQKYDHKYSILASKLNAYPTELLSSIPEDWLFLDVEATGFRNSGAQIVMIGLGRMVKGDFLTDIYFARSPFEEKLVLKETISQINKASKVFTFNGKTYDIPLIEERAFANMIEFEFDREHNDLYLSDYKPYAKANLYPKATFKSFEKTELHIDRRGDISGSQVPQIYENYLLGRSEDRIKHVIVHNFPDIISMPFAYLHSQGMRFSNEPREISFNDFKHLFEKKQPSNIYTPADKLLV